MVPLVEGRLTAVELLLCGGGGVDSVGAVDSFVGGVS